MLPEPGNVFDGCERATWYDMGLQAQHPFGRAHKVMVLGTLLQCLSVSLAVSQVWVQEYSHETDAEDHIRIIRCDNARNTVAVGYTRGGRTSSDLLVLKMADSGALLWARTWNRVGATTEEGWDAASGQDGSVFVTGFSYPGTDLWQSDIVTLAYSESGTPLWTNTFGTPGQDMCQAIEVDGNDNVVVAGFSPKGLQDYLVIKYSAQGTPLWTNFYNGPANGDDRAYAVKADSVGRVFVTGASKGSHEDYATVAYDNSGAALWTNHYNGLASGTDVAYDLALGDDGSVYVTGESASAYTSSDFATIAYSSTGTPLWTNRYNGPANGVDRALWIAVRNNVVAVTGSSDGGSIATITYSTSGTPLSTNRIKGFARKAAVDQSGDVYITGGDTLYGWLTVKYSAGEGVWTNRSEGAGDTAFCLGVNNAGELVVGGDAGSDALLMKYSASGVVLWTNRFTGIGNMADEPRAITAGKSGRVFVTGSSRGNQTYEDYATVAYSSGGVPLWTNRYDSSEGSDYALLIASGPNDEVYVSGATSSRRLATVAYSAEGKPLWTNVSAGLGSHWPHGVAVMDTGDVFVTGRFGDLSSFWTICYSSNGVVRWTNNYSLPGESGLGTAISVVNRTNVAITGRMGAAIATLLYSSDGKGIWTNTFVSPQSTYDTAQAMVTGANSTISITGSSSHTNVITLTYSSSGVLLWTNYFNSLRGGSDYAVAIGSDDLGNVFVAAVSENFQGVDEDYVTLAYSPTGHPLWTNRYGSIGEDVPATLAVDQCGNVIVAGRSLRETSNFDYATVCYSRKGDPIWTNRYSGPAGGDNQVLSKSSLAIGPQGEVYVTGSSDGDYSGSTVYNFATIKYAPTLSPLWLRFHRDGDHVRLLWDHPAFHLQSAYSPSGAWIDIPEATSPYTNLSQLGSRFFRLRGNGSD